MNFSIELEAMSLVVIVIIALFHFDRSSNHNKRYHLFNACLVLTTLAIVMNIVSCVMLKDIPKYPMAAHMAANSMYFLAIHCCFTLIASYIFILLFAHMKEQKCYRRAMTIVGLMNVVLNVLVVVNLWTGCLFYFEDNVYCRGPLNKLSFVVVGIEACMLCMCYFRNRKNVSPYAKQLVKMLPIILVTLMTIQILLPDILLVGTMAALANLIIYACFQNNRIGRDALTELPNRTSFFGALQHRKRKNRKSHIALLHICNLAKVNRRYGMSGGDSLLYNIARYLENVSSNYRVYRFGNTHFMMLGDFHSQVEADAIVEGIYARFMEPWTVCGQECMQQIQLIHMELEASEMDENSLIERLNYMLSYSKDKNESVKMFFDEAVKKLYERKLYVLSEVKKALENETFELYYQPVYFCKEKKFKTAEVLLRLFTEDGTPISPGEFIPIAEENGLGDDISWLVFKKGMKFVMEHTKLPIDSISINMSIQQMRQSYVERKIEELSESYHKFTDKIRIEITEGMITQNPELTTRVMTNLVNGGLDFYLDDFGVGYSNFARMLDLPFEVVKLDRSLIQNIDTNEKSYNMVRSMVEMLHNTGFIVLAEGVERESQVEKMLELNVDRIQGFYYARPMSEKDVVEFFGKQ